MRWRLGIAALLLLACAAPALPEPWPHPVLHPNLAEALARGFDLLVGRAPLAVRFSVENAAGYEQHWDLGGGAVSEAPGAWRVGLMGYPAQRESAREGRCIELGSQCERPAAMPIAWQQDAR